MRATRILRNVYTIWAFSFKAHQPKLRLVGRCFCLAMGNQVNVPTDSPAGAVWLWAHMANGELANPNPNPNPNPNSSKKCV